MTKPREIDPQTEKHIERFLAGQEVWNEWARDMLARKEKLVEKGKWPVGFGFDDQYNLRHRSDNPEVQVWLDESHINFSSLELNGYKNFDIDEPSSHEDLSPISIKQKIQKLFYNGLIIDLANFIFPEEVNFNNTIFKDKVDFSKAEIKEQATFQGASLEQGAKFYKTIFNDLSYFGNAQFKGDVNFDRAWFRDISYFNETRFKNSSSFCQIEFEKCANFSKSRFTGETIFSAAQFRADAIFSGAIFKGEPDFENAVFLGISDFKKVIFKEKANFRDATFIGTADFQEAVFLKGADFRGASFNGEAFFHAVDFFKTTNFSQARFNHVADFEAIEVKRAFSLADAQFLNQVPNYSQAHFAESPRLDHVEVRPFIKKKSPFSWHRYFWQERFLSYFKRGFHRTFFQNPLNSWRRFSNFDRNPNDEAYYRALKRLAIQSHDHENEMEFFAGELRSRRHLKDFASPHKGLASALRYWAGVLYEVTSDFGRSLWRPAAWWGATFALFASLYFANANPSALEKCREAKVLTPFAAANTIAAKHSLPFFTMDRTEKLKRSYGCLYGAAPLYHASYYDQQNTGQPKAHSTPKTPLATRRLHMAPSVPGWVTFLGVGNMVLSLIFIFLLLLAIRNQFRIK